MSNPGQNDQEFEDFGQLPGDALADESLGTSSGLGGDFGEISTDVSAGVEASPGKLERQAPVIAREKVPLQEQVKRADVFIVMLAISLVAILIAILCLFSELGSYHFELRAKSAAVAVVVPSDLAESSGLLRQIRAHFSPPRHVSGQCATACFKQCGA